MGIIDHFNTNQGENSLNLVCTTSDPGSYKCIFLANYRRLPIDIEWEQSEELKHRMSNSLGMSEYICSPSIYDSNFSVCGSKAVLTYLNMKGSTPSLHPHTAKQLALQQYWIQIANARLEPLVHEIPKYEKEVRLILDAFDTNLMNNKSFVIGEWSLADIHWSGLIKYLQVQGHGDIVTIYENLKNWLDKVKLEIPIYEEDCPQLAA